MRTKRLGYRKNPLRGENLWVCSVDTVSEGRMRIACDPPLDHLLSMEQASESQLAVGVMWITLASQSNVRVPRRSPHTYENAL
jgi:hypothetical protein